MSATACRLIDGIYFHFGDTLNI